MSAGDPYEALADLAEVELLVVSIGDLGRLHELESIAARRAELVGALPAVPPPHARPALERAAACQQRTSDALAKLSAGVRRKLGEVEHGRRTARGYAPAATGARGLDLAG